MGQIVSDGKWVAYPWIRYVSRKLTPAIFQGNARFLITAPPQHGKSAFMSEWLPTWFLKTFPDRSVILATYAQSYSDKYGVKIRDHLRNPKVGVRIRDDSASKRRIVLQDGGQLLTAGVGGPITGEPAHLFIVDDPFKTYEEAMSERIRERNLDWFRSVATTRLQSGGSVVVMHTRWHESDLIGTLMEEQGWVHINLPAVAEEDDPLGRAVGEPLCPERFTREDLEQKRTEVKEMIWSALYQGSPIQRSGNIIQGDWIRRYRELPVMEEVGIFADLTYKDGEENDYTVVECWGRRGPDVYLISQIRGHMGFFKQLEAIERMIGLHPDAFHKEIEEKANGAAVIEVVKERFPGLVANKPRTEKAARLAAVAPMYHAGNVHYPDETLPGNEWVKENIKEITKFPRAKHDDTVDVASMAVAHFGRLANTLRAYEALGSM